MTPRKVKPRGAKAPLPGRYGGTIGGEPAVFHVTGGAMPAVSAQWFKLMPNGEYRPHHDAWDIEGGRFVAKTSDNSTGRYSPVKVTIRRR